MAAGGKALIATSSARQATNCSEPVHDAVFRHSDARNDSISRSRVSVCNHMIMQRLSRIAAAFVIAHLWLGNAASMRAAEPIWPPVFIDIHGQKIEPFRETAARAMALIFVLPDCPIASSYCPEINRLWQINTERGITLIIVHADRQITVEQARKHAEQYQLKCPVVLDAEHEWVTKTGVRKTPEAAVLSPQGDLLYRGRIDDRFVDLGKRREHVTTHDLRDAFDAIAAGRPVAQARTEAIGCFIPGIPRGK
jgi:hypothetical protein